MRGRGGGLWQSMNQNICKKGIIMIIMMWRSGSQFNLALNEILGNINNGNRSEWSPICSLIICVINKV